MIYLRVTVKKKKRFLACSIAFYIDSTNLCSRDTNSNLCIGFSRLVDPVQLVLIFLILFFFFFFFFFLHDMLTIIPPQKLNDGSATLFV